MMNKFFVINISKFSEKNNLGSLKYILRNFKIVEITNTSKTRDLTSIYYLNSKICHGNQIKTVQYTWVFFVFFLSGK